jgi:pyruvate/2-oxoglutarate dehydrogenase complex dihydrolipoamide dehydrogenase (E3) component
LPLLLRLCAAGMKVAIIERKLFGGTCVNTGCIPTKTLVASAYAAYLACRAADYGVTTEGRVGVDMRAVKARMDAVSGRSRNGVESWMRGLAGCTVYQGHARFVGPHEVAVDNEVMAASRIFLNVGGRASVPPIGGLDQVDYLTNSSMMKVDFLPRHLIIVGGSYVGLEFAQMYRRFGSDVTVIEMAPRIIAREDKDVSRAVTEILAGEGVTIRTGATCLAVARHGGEIAVNRLRDRRRQPARPRSTPRLGPHNRLCSLRRSAPPARRLDGN